MKNDILKKTMKIEPKTLKGFRDFLPKEAKKRQYTINILRSVFESYGFEPLETPALEYEEILLGKYGEEGDKLMYRFEDLGGRKVALRYDQTVPLARVVSQYQNELTLPFKRYQIQPVWRAENTQKGRFREFLQCDADIVGLDTPLSDAEIIAIIIKAFEKLGFKNFKVLINDRENLQFYKDGIALSQDRNILAVRAIDKLKKIGRDEVVKELIEYKFSENEANELLNTVDQTKPTQRLSQIFTLLKEMGINENLYEFSPTLARGLDYYTGIILEIEAEEYLTGSLGGGGRYDKLIEMFAGREIPAVGFAFGFDRLIEAMEQLNLFPADLNTTTKVLVTIFSPELKEKSIEVSSRLRSNNVSTEIYLDENAKMEKQLKYADQKNIPYVLIIGPEEMEKDMVTVRDMKTREQKTVPLTEVIEKLK